MLDEDAQHAYRTHRTTSCQNNDTPDGLSHRRTVLSIRLNCVGIHRSQKNAERTEPKQLATKASPEAPCTRLYGVGSTLSDVNSDRVGQPDFCNRGGSDSFGLSRIIMGTL
jgi:hypothetical protein